MNKKEDKQPQLPKVNVMRGGTPEPLPPKTIDDIDSAVASFAISFRFWFKMEPKHNDAPTVEDLLYAMICVVNGGNGV